MINNNRLALVKKVGQVAMAETWGKIVSLMEAYQEIVAPWLEEGTFVSVQQCCDRNEANAH